MKKKSMITTVLSVNTVQSVTLSSSSFASRGPHRDDKTDSNFTQLLKLKREDDSRISSWMGTITYKYTSGDIQNKIFKIKSLDILHQKVESLHSIAYYTLWSMKQNDSLDKEQAIICV